MKKKNIFIILLIMIITLFSFHTVFASFADYDDTTADAASKKEEQQQKEKVTDSVTKSNNNYLSNLEVVGYKLSPEFNKQTMNYEINDVISKSEIEIQATTDNSTASVDGIGKIELNSGENNLSINVTAENGDVRTYIIKVNTNSNVKLNENNINDENNLINLPNTTPNIENIALDNTNSDGTTFQDNYIKYIIYGIIAIILLIVIILIINNINKKGKKRINKH